MKKTLTSVLTAAAMVAALTATFGAFAAPHVRHLQARLVEVNGSGVDGIVNLVRLPRGTMIGLEVSGPTPGARYASLYYSSRDCSFTDDGDSGVISGAPYDATASGVGHVQGVVDDGIYTINSVSVRDAATYRLLACAEVAPEY